VISDANILSHIKGPNKVDSKRTWNDEEVGPIASLLAQFV
jgi:hypothetical protein